MKCDRKGYASEGIAKSVVFRLRAQGVYGVKEYRCFCGRWHVAKDRTLALR